MSGLEWDINAKSVGSFVHIQERTDTMPGTVPVVEAMYNTLYISIILITLS